MSEELKLKLGEQFYHVEHKQKFTVVHEDSSAYYLAVFDGTSSKVEYESKKCGAKDFPTKWFRYREEMYQQRVKNAEKTLFWLK